MSQQSFYNKINQVSLAETIEFLGHNKSELVLKVRDQFVKTNINSRKSTTHFSVLKFTTYNFSNEPVTCSFDIKDDVYFFTTFINSDENDYSLDVPDTIYQLQRRNDYRVSMPIGMVYKCEIININGAPVSIKTEIRDMSLGGCMLSISPKITDVKQGDEIDIYLKLDRFEFTKIALTAKHIKFLDEMNTVMIGASFYEPNATMTAELQALMMHLDRVHRGKSLE